MFKAFLTDPLLRTVDDLNFANLDETIKPSATQIGGKWVYLNVEKSWQEKALNPELHLFVHGLFGKSQHWKKYIDRVDNLYDVVLAPEVVLKGNCSLEEASEPLTEIVLKFLKEFPGATVNLYGTSNGARLISKIECDLARFSASVGKLNVVSIVGVHYGTKIIDLLISNYPFLTKKVLHQSIIDEFQFGSAVAQNLLQDWKEAQQAWKEREIEASHLFISTENDEKVYPNWSSLPTIEGATYTISEGNHQSVVDHSLNTVLEWINSQALNNIFKEKNPPCSETCPLPYL